VNGGLFIRIRPALGEILWGDGSKRGAEVHANSSYSIQKSGLLRQSLEYISMGGKVQSRHWRGRHRRRELT